MAKKENEEKDYNDVLLIQNTRIEGSGLLGTLIENDGFKIRSIHAKKENIPDSKFSLIVILGAPESANDNLSYLRREEQLIQDAIENNIPTLGICLGSQLMAKALGGRVFKGSTTEIGFYSDLKKETNNTTSKLFEGFSNPFTVFHWHSDTFELPPNAERLAFSSEYENQAFRFGSGVGLQFHLEVTSEMVNLWLDNTEETLLRKIPYIDPSKIRKEIDTKISDVNENMERFYKNFKSVFNL